MNRKESHLSRINETVAMMMIGEGVIAALAPDRHVGLWQVGPDAFRKLAGRFRRRPGLTRALGIAEAALGVWMANRQLAR